jgi:hypothetical protein
MKNPLNYKWTLYHKWNIIHKLIYESQTNLYDIDLNQLTINDEVRYEP